MNPVRLNIQSLKYQTFTLSGCKDIGKQKLKRVAKTHFLKMMNFQRERNNFIFARATAYR